MKSVKNDKADDVTYPCLMEKQNGPVVLFVNGTTGVVVSGTDFYNVGYYTTGWLATTFTPYTGTVTLSN